jgi:RNA polymerase sigma-70 factor (ECF subfamily)
MDNIDLPQHLSQISTLWNVVASAHETAEEERLRAQRRLVQRYWRAIYTYLLGITRDEHLANDLLQEFALRLVRGDFRRADPARGRFRDFLKKALVNLVISYRRQQNRAALQLPNGVPEAAASAESMDLEREFLAHWRQVLLERAWQGLAAAEKPGGPPFHKVLRRRAEKPDLSSGQLAEQLTAELHPDHPFTDSAIRKIIQRARELFADLLVAEVARSLGEASLDELEEEIIDLGFQAYCRQALERRRIAGKH